MNGQIKKLAGTDSDTCTEASLLCAHVRIVAHSCAVITSREKFRGSFQCSIIQHVDGFCLIFYTPLLNQGLGICWCPMTTTVNLRIG